MNKGHSKRQIPIGSEVARMSTQMCQRGRGEEAMGNGLSCALPSIQIQSKRLSFYSSQTFIFLSGWVGGGYQGGRQVSGKKNKKPTAITEQRQVLV